MNLPAKFQAAQLQPVHQGLSGASLFRGIFAQRDCFLKITPQDHRLPVKAEHARLEWLRGRIPVAEVIHYHEDEASQYLVTAAVQGLPLFEYQAEPDWLLRKFAEAMRLLHDLPALSCPFSWTIDDQIAFARSTLENNEVKVDLLDSEFHERDLVELFEEMVSLRPQALDLVVVHGDPYNDNILLHPQTGDIAAFIDVGNTGVADRYTDLAMIYDDVLNTFGEAGWQSFLRYYGLEALDERKMRFYRLFNEFM